MLLRRLTCFGYFNLGALFGAVFKSYTTTFEKRIMVNKKLFEIQDIDTDTCQKCNTRFTLSDTQNNEYRFHNTTFDNSELHILKISSSVEEGKLYNISYYGWRIPPLNMYPNIRSIEHIE